MDQEFTGTKLDLILAAGELFAERGLEGTSIRAIAKKAGVNIAAINYHFNGKENLYIETLRYVMSQTDRTKPVDFFNKNKISDTGKHVDALYAFIKNFFQSHFLQNKPSWAEKLMMRTMLEPTPGLISIVGEFFIPELEEIIEFICKANPDISKKRARIAAFSIYGQFTFYIFSRPAVLMILKKTEYSKSFIECASEFAARSIVSAIAQPINDELV